MEKKKVFDVTIEGSELLGTYAVSYVGMPAIDEDFKHFDKVVLQKLDEEKRMVYGPAMIANKLILRISDTGEEFYVRFPPETVRQMAHRYLMTNNHQHMTVDHETDAPKGVVVVESWLKEDSNDKSISLGFEDLPNPTWFIGSHVPDDGLWEKIKSGEVRGFSIEADLKLVEAKLSSTFGSFIKELEDAITNFTGE